MFGCLVVFFSFHIQQYMLVSSEHMIETYVHFFVQNVIEISANMLYIYSSWILPSLLKPMLCRFLVSAEAP